MRGGGGGRMRPSEGPSLNGPHHRDRQDPSDESDGEGSYESQQDIQLMRFTDYFGKAFAAVSGSQFPWSKLFKESPVSKIIDCPDIFRLEL
ncbi:uncharacterized protein A4U43_C06F15820 [Asparagus officinalis]|uniref:Uncharacterized protein n=1 Tax=Asparagus officinalis TaxID=4686 RepID=A0A5P1ESS3_ASPOF|nr:uncharacterized protein A4U43_C06F15820 [Asparagus officinalis]